MEKVSFKNSKGLELKGDLYGTSGEKIIILCHAFTWDRHDGGRFDKLAQGLFQRGFSVLAFDFSANGESEGEIVSLSDYIDDLKSAIDFAQSRGYSRIGIAGRSLGCLVAAKTNDPRVKTMVFWAPDTKRRESFLFGFENDQRVEFQSKGYFTMVTPQPNFRKFILVGKEMVRERENINQEEIFEKIEIPVLVIHGDNDQVISFENSKEIISYLPQKSRLDIIPGADHRFTENLHEVINCTQKWFEEFV